MHAIISYDAVVNDELVYTVSRFYFWVWFGFFFCNQICVSYGIVSDRLLFKAFLTTKDFESHTKECFVKIFINSYTDMKNMNEIS